MLKTVLQYTILLLLVCVPFTGCAQPNPDGREDVSGTITLNGQPLVNGSINFSDKDPAQAGGAGGLISNGKFHLTGEYAIKPGDYKVRLYGAIDYDRSTGEPATNETPIGRLIPIELIPPDFNRNSTIEFTVEKGKKNVFDYDVVADPPVVKPATRKSNLE